MMKQYLLPLFLATTLLPLPGASAAGEPCGSTAIGLVCQNGAKCIETPMLPQGSAESFEAIELGDGTVLEIHQTEIGFRCECPPEWAGVDCTVQIMSCADGEHSCLNGGECAQNEDTGAVYCDCTFAGDDKGREYIGTFCEQVAPVYCSRKDETAVCFNGGECSDSYPEKGGPCVCPPGFGGPHCEKEGSNSSGREFMGIDVGWWVAMGVALVGLIGICCLGLYRWCRRDRPPYPRRRPMRRSTYKGQNISQRLDWKQTYYEEHPEEQRNLAPLGEENGGETSKTDEPRRKSFTERMMYKITRELPFRRPQKDGQMVSFDDGEDNASAVSDDDFDHEPTTSNPGFLRGWFKAKKNKNKDKDKPEASEALTPSSHKNPKGRVSPPITPEKENTYGTGIFGAASGDGSDEEMDGDVLGNGSKETGKGKAEEKEEKDEFVDMDL